jgi:hypothetical protein
LFVFLQFHFARQEIRSKNTAKKAWNLLELIERQLEVVQCWPSGITCENCGAHSRSLKQSRMKRIPPYVFLTLIILLLCCYSVFIIYMARVEFVDENQQNKVRDLMNMPRFFDLRPFATLNDDGQPTLADKCSGGPHLERSDMGFGKYGQVLFCFCCNLSQFLICRQLTRY